MTRCGLTSRNDLWPATQFQSVFGKSCQAFLLVVVPVLVLGFSGLFDYEHEGDDENEASLTFSRHALSGVWLPAGVGDSGNRSPHFRP